MERKTDGMCYKGRNSKVNTRNCLQCITSTCTFTRGEQPSNSLFVITCVLIPFRNSLLNRGTKVCVVLIQKNAPLPPGSFQLVFQLPLTYLKNLWLYICMNYHAKVSYRLLKLLGVCASNSSCLLWFQAKMCRHQSEQRLFVVHVN